MSPFRRQVVSSKPVTWNCVVELISSGNPNSIFALQVHCLFASVNMALVTNDCIKRIDWFSGSRTSASIRLLKYMYPFLPRPACRHMHEASNSCVILKLVVTPHQTRAAFPTPHPGLSTSSRRDIRCNLPALFGQWISMLPRHSITHQSRSLGLWRVSHNQLWIPNVNCVVAADGVDRTIRLHPHLTNTGHDCRTGAGASCPPFLNVPINQQKLVYLAYAVVFVSTHSSRSCSAFRPQRQYHSQ